MYVPNGKEQGDQPWLTFAFACDKWSCVADKCLGVDSTLQLYCAHYELLAKKKDKDRRKGKGHCFCLGEDFIQFLAAQAILTRTIIMKNTMNSSFSFRSSWCNSSYI